MCDYLNTSIRFKDIYNIDGSPIAVYYSNEPDPEGDKKKGFVCVHLQRAKKGAIVNLSLDNVTCPGGIHWLGFADYKSGLKPFLTQMELFFKDESDAEKFFESVPEPPLSYAGFVIIKPLEMAQSAPDMVVFITNSHDAHRIHTVLIYSEPTLCLQGYFTATCQASIGIPFVTQKPSIFLPDTASRGFARFTDNDVIVSLPYKYFVKLSENLDKSSGGTAEVRF